jgi:hypothetical protein
VDFLAELFGACATSWATCERSVATSCAKVALGNDTANKKAAQIARRRIEVSMAAGSGALPAPHSS